MYDLIARCQMVFVFEDILCLVATPQPYVRSMSKLNHLLPGQLLLLSNHVFMPWVNSIDVRLQVLKTCFQIKG